MNRFLLAGAGLLASALVVGTLAAAAPAGASEYNLECAGPSTWPICDLSASGSSAGFSNERWSVNDVAYPNGDNRSSVKFYCPVGSVSIAIGVYYTDSTGYLYGETLDWYC